MEGSRGIYDSESRKEEVVRRRNVPARPGQVINHREICCHFYLRPDATKKKNHATYFCSKFNQSLCLNLVVAYLRELMQVAMAKVASSWVRCQSTRIARTVFRTHGRERRFWAENFAKFYPRPEDSFAQKLATDSPAILAN